MLAILQDRELGTCLLHVVRTRASTFWSEGLTGIFNGEKLYLCRRAPSGLGGEGVDIFPLEKRA